MPIILEHSNYAGQQEGYPMPIILEHSHYSGQQEGQSPLRAAGAIALNIVQPQGLSSQIFISGSRS